MQSLETKPALSQQSDRVALKDANLVYRACSMAFAQTIGWDSPNSIIGRTDMDLLPERVARAQMDLDTQTLRTAQADISTIRLGNTTNLAEASAAMIVRTPVLSDDNIVRGIDIRLVGGPVLEPRSVVPVDYELLVKEGLQGSLIMNDSQVLFANESAASIANCAADTRTQVSARRRDGHAVQLFARVAMVNWGRTEATLLSFIDIGPASVIGAQSTTPTSAPTTASTIAPTKEQTSAQSATAAEPTLITKHAPQMREQLDALQKAVAVNESAHSKMPAASAADCFWELDERLAFRFLSQRVQAVIGVADDRLHGRTFQQWLELPANVNPTAHWDEHLQRLADEKPFRDFEFRWLVEGETRVFRYSGVPVFSPQKKFRGYRARPRESTSV